MSQRPNAARLIVVQGDASRRDLDITKAVELGRGDACDIVLLDGAASRRHARFEVRGSDYYVLDLGSTNGTFVNGVRIHEARLTDGDEIVLGGVRCKFRAAMPAETMVVGAAPAARGSAGPAKEGDAAGARSPIGRNALFLAARALAERAAMADLPVLLRGETGTGKEIFAQFVHSRSSRAQQPFVALHAAAIPAALFESELFGSEKGAFTGANARREGYIARANGGTLFLDEVGELPLDAQIKLLRVLETGEYHSIGSSAAQHSNFRLIAATNRDLEQAVRAGTFRSDLLFRLNVIEIRLPALRERLDDLPLFVTEFLKPTGRFASQGLIEELTLRNWAGNVRELKNVLEHASLLADGPEIRPEHLPVERDPLDSTIVIPSRTDDTRPSAISLEEAEKAVILKALQKTGGRRGDAARLLGIAEPTLRRKLKRYGLAESENA